MQYISAFLTGGLICALSQILIDRTKLTPARILVSYVVLGVILTALGIYQPIVDFGGAGATVPLLGFGYSLAKGVAKGVAESGLLGAFTGGITGAAGGIAAAIIFGCLFALICKPEDKSGDTSVGSKTSIPKEDLSKKTIQPAEKQENPSTETTKLENGENGIGGK